MIIRFLNIYVHIFLDQFGKRDRPARPRLRSAQSHAQNKSHSDIKTHQRCQTITDKGQRQTGIWQKAGRNANIDKTLKTDDRAHSETDDLAGNIPGFHPHQIAFSGYHHHILWYYLRREGSAFVKRVYSGDP